MWHTCSALWTHIVSSYQKYLKIVTPSSHDFCGLIGWSLEDKVDNELKITEEQLKGGKICLTKVLQPMEDFLHETFTPINNVSQWQLQQQFVMMDTSFTTAPHLDKMITDECSKSIKMSNQSFSQIQALFLDVIGPLSEMLDSTNKGTKLAVEDIDDVSSQYTSFRRTGILKVYNKDLVFYGLESNELFSVTTTLQRPAFPQKAAVHLQQMQTLRNSQAVPSKIKQKASVPGTAEGESYIQPAEMPPAIFQGCRSHKSPTSHQPK